MSETMRQTCDAGLTQYVNSLALSASTLCRSNSGQPGRLVWTPDENTPDVVYYQVYTLFIQYYASCMVGVVRVIILYNII